MYTFDELLNICKTEINTLKFTERAPFSLYEPILYTLGNSGKRLRPVALLMATNIFSDDISKAINSALAIEVFHNFTLLHDDIMDNASTRRGVPSVHKKWNENAAILSGDAMSLYSFKLLCESDKALRSELLDIFIEMSLQVCEGQQSDMEFENMTDVSVADYLNMIRLKTSVLIAGAMKMGAICGGANTTQADALYEVGINLGLAFQIQDDVLDTYSNCASFGKNIGGDILEGKKTYLLLTTYEQASEVDKVTLNNILKYEKDGQVKIDSVKKMYDKYGVRTIAEQKIKEYYDKSISLIDALDVPCERKEPIRELSDIVLTRKK